MTGWIEKAERLAADLATFTRAVTRRILVQPAAHLAKSKLDADPELGECRGN